MPLKVADSWYCTSDNHTLFQKYGEIAIIGGRAQLWKDTWKFLEDRLSVGQNRAILSENGMILMAYRRHKRTFEADTDDLGRGQYDTDYVKRVVFGLNPQHVGNQLDVDLKRILEDHELPLVDDQNVPQHLRIGRPNDFGPSKCSVCWLEECKDEPKEARKKKLRKCSACSHYYHFFCHNISKTHEKSKSWKCAWCDPNRLIPTLRDVPEIQIQEDESIKVVLSEAQILSMLGTFDSRTLMYLLLSQKREGKKNLSFLFSFFFSRNYLNTSVPYEWETWDLRKQAFYFGNRVDRSKLLTKRPEKTVFDLLGVRNGREYFSKTGVSKHANHDVSKMGQNDMKKYAKQRSISTGNSFQVSHPYTNVDYQEAQKRT